MTNNADLVRQLLALLAGDAGTTTTDSVVGKYCIVRCKDAGVHAGVVRSVEGRSCFLEQSRRLWRFRVPMGAPSFLSGVSTHGLDHSDSKVGTKIDALLTEICEVIPCSEVARKSIESAPETERVH